MGRAINNAFFTRYRETHHWTGTTGLMGFAKKAREERAFFALPILQSAHHLARCGASSNATDRRAVLADPCVRIQIRRIDATCLAAHNVSAIDRAAPPIGANIAPACPAGIDPDPGTVLRFQFLGFPLLARRLTLHIVARD